jgi:hypothetical protein
MRRIVFSISFFRPMLPAQTHPVSERRTYFKIKFDLDCAKKLKVACLKHGTVYRLSRFGTGPNRGDWLVVVQYDQAAHETLQAAIAQDAECQQAFAEIAKFANRISQELVLDLDL